MKINPEIKREQPIEDLEAVEKRLEEVVFNRLTDSRWMYFQLIELTQRCRAAEAGCYAKNNEIDNLKDLVEQFTRIRDYLKEDNDNMKRQLKLINDHAEAITRLSEEVPGE